MRRALTLGISRRPLVGTERELHDYLRLDIGFERVELVKILFLDSGHRLLRDETMWRGTVDRVPLYAREVVARAIELGAASIIVVHNHPSGDPSPSPGDVISTRELDYATGVFGIELLDHVIVADEGFRSLRRSGLLHHA